MGRDAIVSRQSSQSRRGDPKFQTLRAPVIRAFSAHSVEHAPRTSVRSLERKKAFAMIHLNPPFAFIAKTAVSLTALGLLYAQPYRLMRVVGQSMEPTYKSQSILWTVPVHDTDLRKGDVVVIRRSTGTIVKRIAYMPGDEIEQVWTGTRWSSLIEVHPRSDVKKSKNLYRELIVPHGMVYVLGDNRPVSMDSRSFGYVPEASIESKLVDQRRSAFNPNLFTNNGS